MERDKSFNYSVLVYFLIVVFFVAFRLLSSFGLLNFLGSSVDKVFTIVVQIFLLLGGSIVMYSALKKQRIKRTFTEFAIRKTSWKVVWLSVLLGVAVFFINTFVSASFNGLIELFGYEHASGTPITSYSFGALIVNIFFTAVLPGICEEVAHRGMLLRAFTPLGAWKAIFLSALLFGLLHLNIEQFFYATIIGIFLGFLTMMSNSIIPAMIVHFMNNALSVYVTFSAVNGLPLGNLLGWFDAIISSNIFMGILHSLIVLIALVYLAYFITIKIIQSRTKEDMALIQKQFSAVLMRQSYFAELEKAKLNAKGEQPKESEFDPFEKLKDFIMVDEPADEGKFKPSKYSIILLSGTFVMGVVITIFTFVWGVL